MCNLISEPDATWQLPDKIVESYSLDGNRLDSTRLIQLTTKPDLTPTISSMSAKVMRLDYKIRVTVELQNRNKVLSVNLPLVIGTKQTIHQKPAVYDLDSSNHDIFQTGDYLIPSSSPNSMDSTDFVVRCRHQSGLSEFRKRTQLSSVRSTVYMSPYFGSETDSPSHFQSSSIRSMSVVYSPHQQPLSPECNLVADVHKLFSKTNSSPMQSIPEDTLNNGNTSQFMRSSTEKYLFTPEAYEETIGLLQRYTFALERGIQDDELGRLSCDSLFLEATEENSIIISLSEFTGMKFKKKSLNAILRENFPNGLGLHTRHVNKEIQHIEINFESAKERNEALTKKLVIFNKNIQINRPLDKDTTVYRVEISNIPMQNETKLKSHMIDTFKKYGEILEIGIYRTNDGGWFTGKGFVTLHKHKYDSMYHQLAPQIISWKAHIKLHLAYSNINPTCKYCHGDHTRSNCPIIAARKRSCFQCGSFGHLKANCPLTRWDQSKNNHGSAGSLPNNVVLQEFSVPEMNESDIQTVSVSDDMAINFDSDQDTLEHVPDFNSCKPLDPKRKRFPSINNMFDHFDINRISNIEV